MVFYIDIVGSCNLRCAGCPSSVFGKRTPERMSLELFHSILDKIVSEYPVQSLGFYNWTEPLLHPDVARFIAATKRKQANLTTVVSSNLSLKNIDPLLWSIDEGLDYLVVSLSGFSQEAHRKYHVSGNIELVKANIMKVSQYVANHRRKTHIDVHFLQFNDNQQEGELIKEFCGHAGVGYFPKQAYYAKGVDTPDILTRLKCAPNPKKISTEVDLDQAAKNYDERNSEPCEQVFDMVAMDCRGEVFLCCSRYYLDEYRIGCFLELTPEEILYRKVIHPECYSCRGIRRPATATDFNRLQKALYLASKKDSAAVKQLLTGSIYPAPEYKNGQRSFPQ